MTSSGHPSVLQIAADWQDQGHGVAIATVISTWGSAPRPTGSQLVIRDDGLFEGSVSGGCIEGAVITEAQEVIRDGKARTLEFGVSNSDAWEVGLACGGKIRILLEALEPKAVKRAQLDRLLKAQTGQRAAVVATHLESGESALFLPDQDSALVLLGHDLTNEALSALRSDKAQIIDAPAGEIFLNVFNAPLRMIIVDAVHIAQALAPMAQAAGFAVNIIDPRGAFADAERFQGTKVIDAIIEDWPDDALKAAPPDARTAVITLTHDPKLDDAALIVALKSPAFYIGSLGSRKTHAARLERLEQQGIADDTLGRINGPIGLNIGAKSAAEIAVSIMAQVIEQLRKSPE